MILPLNLWLVHPEKEMADAFRRRFEGLPRVEVFDKRFEEVPAHDCFVTAGNSFGMMTAGIDAAVVHLLGRAVMTAVQRTIVADYLGEQPVGTAFVMETGHAKIPWLVHAPSMRVPGSIDGTANVYFATFAALVAIGRHNGNGASPIRTVGFPAFGTGFGSVSFDEAARQMAAVPRDVFRLAKMQLRRPFVEAAERFADADAEAFALWSHPATHASIRDYLAKTVRK